MSYSAWTTERVEVDIANLQLSAAKARLIRLTYPLLFLSFFLWLLLSPITCGPVPYLCTIIDALSGPECVRIQQSSKGYTMIAMSQIWDLVYSSFGYTLNLLLFFFFFIMQFRNLTHCFYLSESDSLFFYKHHRFRCRSGSEPAGPEGFNSANSQLTKYIEEKFSFLFSFMDPCLVICFEFTCLGCRYPPGIKAALLLWQHSMLIS